MNRVTLEETPGKATIVIRVDEDGDTVYKELRRKGYVSVEKHPDFKDELREQDMLMYNPANNDLVVCKNPNYYIGNRTDNLVNERGKTHGKFSDHARCTQRLKAVFTDELDKRSMRNQPDLTNKQVEAIDMILHKIGRIVAGQSDFQDHWDDIAGYARIANDDNV